MKAILGTKVGMTTVYNEKAVPVTVIDVSNCRVAAKNGEALELGLGDKKKPNKPLVGKYKALKSVPQFVKSFKNLDGDLNVGDEIKPETFEVGEKVLIKGVTKGRGFQGVIKRWGFKGGQRTHGQSDRLRAPGSIGAGTDPGRVLKGKKMAGKTGTRNKTVENVQIVKIADNLIAVKGQVPGNRGDLVVIKSE